MKVTKQTAAIIILSAFFIQLIIIIYNQLTGFIQISGILNFLIRILYGTFFSSIFGIVIFYLDLKTINFLNEKFFWSGKPVLRFLLEVLTAILIGIAVGCLITLSSHIVSAYDNLAANLITNSLITIVINFVAIGILEAVLFFKRGQESALKAERLERENTQIRLETLKNQLNPHFLFNSLNVLSALVRKDADKSQEFIDEFSSTYRYILDVIDKPVVELKEELSFAKSYLYLQKIRFEDSIKTEINIEAERMNNLIPPLAVQVLLENAFKHNRINSENPLILKIFNEDNFLFVTNNLQPKMNKYNSKGIGLDNLKKRYKFVAGEEPEFIITENKYIAKIPLITPD